MRTIRFIQLGDDNNTLLHNLSLILTRVQETYDFIFDDDIVPIPADAPMLKGKYICRHLEDLVRDYIYQRKHDEYIVAVTGLPLNDDLAYSTNSSIALLSTHDWDSFSSFPIIKGMEYFVAGVLLDRLEIGGVHQDVTMACPNDFCDERSDIDRGILKSEFCHDCRAAILTGLENGKLTLQDVVAIYRILDHVAERKLCFVLMPFKAKFNEPYEAMKRALEMSGFVAGRADEVFETRSIMQIVCEQIGRSEIIIADLTDRNPNVFYEVGYAHALGKNTILVTQTANDVPFDLRHRQYVLYDPLNLENTLTQAVKTYLPNKLK